MYCNNDTGVNVMIYQRHILATLKQSLNEYPITLVTGARQVGKPLWSPSLKKRTTTNILPLTIQTY